MKIVKSFDDNDFFKEFFHLSFEKDDPSYVNGIWRWGLGDDGELYCQSSDFEDPKEWYSLWYNTIIRISSIKTMKKIVKEFGHLLVWL
jgi:hypothetical protein